MLDLVVQKKQNKIKQNKIKAFFLAFNEINDIFFCSGSKTMLIVEK